MPTAPLRRAITAIATAALLLTACAAEPLAQPSWPAPPDAVALAEDAGLEPTDREHLETHTHAHLDVFVDGQHVPVPPGIGIDVEAGEGIRTEPTEDGTGTGYFVDVCAGPCLSPLHTHEPAGIIHTESDDPQQEPFTLGQFFTEWGVRLDDSCVGEFCEPSTSIAVYVNGQKQDGNPADILLESHVEIAVVVGAPPSLIPDSWDFIEPA